jgi:MFS family permease
MTSVAFIMGVLPLVFRRRRRDQAGHGNRRPRRCWVTTFGLFLTPVFFTFIGNLAERFKGRRVLLPQAATLLVVALLLGACTLRPYHAPQAET